MTGITPSVCIRQVAVYGYANDGIGRTFIDVCYEVLPGW